MNSRRSIALRGVLLAMLIACTPTQVANTGTTRAMSRAWTAPLARASLLSSLFHDATLDVGITYLEGFRPIQAAEPHSVIEFHMEYDVTGRATKTTTTSSGEVTRTVDLTYRNAQSGLLSHVDVSGQGVSFRVNFIYDNQDRIIRQDRVQGATTETLYQFEYHDAQHPENATRVIHSVPGAHVDATVTYTYNAAGNITGVTATDGGEVITSYAYTYEVHGSAERISTVTHGTDHFTFDYDSEGRFVSVEGVVQGVPREWQRMTYDADGKPVSMMFTRVLPGFAPESFNYTLTY